MPKLIPRDYFALRSNFIFPPAEYSIHTLTRVSLSERMYIPRKRNPYLEKAAEFIGCNAWVLKESIDRYEASCKAGFDGYLLKNPEYLVPLGGAPYYALHNIRAMDSTQGGITVNRDFEAVTPEGKAIGNMYVVGDHVTGFVSEYYGPGGAGMTWAMVSGFLSSESAAEYIAAK